MLKQMPPACCRWFPFITLALFTLGILCLPTVTPAAEPASQQWQFSSELLEPIWQGDTVRGESVLFIRDLKTGQTTASLLFPAQKVLKITNSAGDITYEAGRDYLWKPGSRVIRLPSDSRIVWKFPTQLRRPANSQRHKLTHRDGHGEIFFGGRLEYHDMQTCITYTHEPVDWKEITPAFDAKALPRTIQKLRKHDTTSIVLLGDSISTGCNASGWAGGAPFQPAFPELLQENLQHHYQNRIQLTNLSVGGKDTRWALTQVDEVVKADPDLVIIAFGMNDSAGRSAEEYKANTKALMEQIRKQQPRAEFILIAPMLGNRDWIRLNHELFPQYRDALAELTKPGVALADMTSLWTEFFKQKKDWDLTGNGVNHPNDFGHRVYAQVLSTLLIPADETNSAAKTSLPPEVFSLWDGKAPIGDDQFEEADVKLTLHRPVKPNGAVIVICPGGGYQRVVTGGEGHGISAWLNQHGITGVVLEYRMPHGRSFVPLSDAQRAIRTVRANAKAWGIDPAKVGIMGFSAGGHLASTAATHFDAGNADAKDPIERQSSRPDFAILVYPVVTMGETTHGGSKKNLLGPEPTPEMIELFSNEKQVTDQTSPIFLAHAIDDKPVPIKNSQDLYAALQEKQIPSKLLELPNGGHGLNGYKGPSWDAWQKQSLEWLADLKFIPQQDAKE
ncbi:GDSL-type esterase/lipase family protein [Gimesia panareensis]|uniref:GDSL-type esterase/lipase family protein n=1 Tax=Gimesia panareensis TaxID=2527978 RepID=UPI001189F58F|nr:GDSL-type esterase/lipase family protein [Gimesia panareensis]QDU53078.1 Acetylxylan esterase precursor [Gimesia panareensis]